MPHVHDQQCAAELQDFITWRQPAPPDCACPFAAAYCQIVTEMLAPHSDSRITEAALTEAGDLHHTLWNATSALLMTKKRLAETLRQRGHNDLADQIQQAQNAQQIADQATAAGFGQTAVALYRQEPQLIAALQDLGQAAYDIRTAQDILSRPLRDCPTCGNKAALPVQNPDQQARRSLTLSAFKIANTVHRCQEDPQQQADAHLETIKHANPAWRRETRGRAHTKS